MAIYLGVDGGGTKTAFVLLTDAGEQLAAVEGPSSYHLEHGFDGVLEVLRQGLAALQAATGVTPDQLSYAFFSLPGYGESSTATARLDTLPGEVLGHGRYRCDNDMVAGRAGSLGGQDGINVIAGTGSMTYGERAGVGTRVGGWGELFGDEGSAHWIGIEALGAFSRMSDGRLPRTALYDALRAQLGVTVDLDVIDVVFAQWNRSRGRIAGLAPVVTTLAASGDAAALDIIERAAQHLVALVEATRVALGFQSGELVPVSYSGGLFHAEPVHARFVAGLAALSGDYRLRTPLFSSHVGAALHAAKLAGQPLDEPALARLAATRAPGAEGSAGAAGAAGGAGAGGAGGATGAVRA
jgi:N-acetylglucosamine kinase-like BadF-type ATPase